MNSRNNLPVSQNGLIYVNLSRIQYKDRGATDNVHHQPQFPVYRKTPKISNKKFLTVFYECSSDYT